MRSKAILGLAILSVACAAAWPGKAEARHWHNHVPYAWQFNRHPGWYRHHANPNYYLYNGYNFNRGTWLDHLFNGRY